MTVDSRTKSNEFDYSDHSYNQLDKAVVDLTMVVRLTGCTDDNTV